MDTRKLTAGVLKFSQVSIHRFYFRKSDSPVGVHSMREIDTQHGQHYQTNNVNKLNTLIPISSPESTSDEDECAYKYNPSVSRWVCENCLNAVCTKELVICTG
mmetsp:Transcript_10615/g.16089  ORF Transcript_10615/g.16089 Transcript_10615/m.16089 type:complete len:103 (-) Transcript_10615:1360-1668(-)